VAENFGADAGLTVEKSVVRLLVDPPPHEPFEQSFAPWPLRFYVCMSGRVSFIAEPEYASFDLQKLTKAVNSAMDAHRGNN
jgi:hypothetical protein